MSASLSPATTATTTTAAGDPVQSLLSLSIAASAVSPIPLASLSTDPFAGHPSSSALGASSIRNQRRLSSTGKAKRRLSDARDAAVRPSPSPAGSLSLAALSLSPASAPVSSDGMSAVTKPESASPVLTSATDLAVGVGSATSPNSIPLVINSKPISIKNGKKRGIEHKCEGCSKVYRHPSCLIKHRWEHTPHWRESSKYVLSKHQQVQLLEAAAILSHFSADSATGTSLPEDRSLWPSFLSGGTLPLPEGSSPGAASDPATVALGKASSSVPANNSTFAPARPPSVGPRLHDYTIPAADVTQVRPGLFMMGGSSAPSGIVSPIAVVTSDSYSQVLSLGPGIGHGRAFSSSGHGSSPSSSIRRAPATSLPTSSYGSTSLSIPRSSLRSGSVFSESERSSSLEEEEAEDEDGDDRMRIYHDYEFELDVDEGEAAGVYIQREGYAFSGGQENHKLTFDDYGFEYERGALNVKVTAPSSVKEEDWDLDMDMD
ncbi:hypothetical protein D9757_007585 [Collybiopsis confluens]|uniref:C2H2-type domain-containing protein n=1 Tax=Collybiopsis confluens TaxID=2823264 RepID=A0A8H5M5Y9_9AGAR|nr:hypothetical protein D9757_007585 [Collybiopsis confluens]